MMSTILEEANYSSTVSENFPSEPGKKMRLLHKPKMTKNRDGPRSKVCESLPFTSSFMVAMGICELLRTQQGRAEKQVRIFGPSVSCPLTGDENGVAILLFCYSDF